jgi:hypothetical protein
MALVFALLPAIAAGRIAAHCWAPVINEAVAALPETGSISGGSLQVKERDARLLAANQFFSVQLSVGESLPENTPVDLSLEFGRYELIVASILGETAIPYPDRWTIPLNRTAYVPFWGAWKGPLLAGFAAGTLLAVIGAWFVLALLYAQIALAIGGLARRDLGFNGAWKLAVAAQWPASLLMTFALALYSTGEIGLLFVFIMFFAHFLPTLLNVLIAPLFVPRAEPKEKGGRAETKNPFKDAKSRKRSSKNPFQGGKG